MMAVSLVAAARRSLSFCTLKRPLVSPLRRVARSYSSEKAEAAYVPLPDELPVGAVIRYGHRERARVLEPGEEPPLRGLSVAVIGASGNTGRQIALALASKKKDFAGLGPMTLQFVGRREGASLGILIGLCSEIRDAYGVCPHLEVVPDLEAVRADVICMAAGATLSEKFKTYPDLVRVNGDIIESYARQLVKKNSQALVLIVSNPMEFGVQTFIEAGFDPRRVLGTGAFFDSLRFRREIASELNVPRQHITGLTLGKHGLAQVPCWSTVRLAAVARGWEASWKLAEMREQGLERINKREITSIRTLAHKIRDITLEGHALHATGLVNSQPPEMRAALRKYVSYFAGPIYPRVGLGEAVSRLVVDLLNGREKMASAQVQVNGEFCGIHGVIGAPIVISGHGVSLAPIDLTPAETESVKKAFEEAQDLQRTVKEIQNLRRLLSIKKKKREDAK